MKSFKKNIRNYATEQYLVLGEGETEELLWKELKKFYLNKNQKLCGKFMKFNPWKNNIKNYRLKLNGHIILIYDTDIENNKKELENFLSNLKQLNHSQNIRYVYMLQQTKSLEDELVYACDKIFKIEELFSSFDCSSKRDFKRRILNMNNFMDKLCELNFDPENMWTKDYSDTIRNSINSYKKLKKSTIINIVQK